MEESVEEIMKRITKNLEDQSVQEGAIQEPYVQEPYIQEPYIQEPYVQDPLVQEPYAQELYACDPYSYAQEPPVQEPGVQEPQIAGQPKPVAKEKRLRATKKERTPMAAARVVLYYACLVVLNVAIALFALYALGLVAEFNWELRGDAIPVVQTIGIVLLFFAPILLTIILCRILHRVFRGKFDFPRGTTLFTLLIIVAVQVLVIWFVIQNFTRNPTGGTWLRFTPGSGMGMGEYLSFFSAIVS